MPLIITKNGSRDFSHSDGFKTMNFSNWEIIFDETLQTVILQLPNGAPFPKEEVLVGDVTVDGIAYATTDLLRAQLIRVGYSPLVTSGGSGGIPDAPNDANAYVRSGLSWVVGYTKSVIDTLLGNKQATLTESVLGTFLNSLTDKNTIIDADLVSSVDTADSNKAKKTTWLNIWTNYLKPKIDAIFALYSKKTRIFLTADIPNTTVADIDVTGFTFTLPASSKCDFRVCLPFTSGATGTGINIGVKIVTGVGANGNVLGNVFAKTRLSTTTTSPIINVVDQGANATVSYSALSGVSTTGLTNVSEVNCDLTNLSTNTSVTVQIVFASENAGVSVDIKRGASMVIDI